MASKSEKTRPSYPELLDIPSVTLTEVGKQVDLTIKTKQRRACFILVGESGLGKTQIVSQIGRKYSYKVQSIHTAQFNLMGGGIPARAVDGFFDIALPSIFPKGEEKAILFFDELNRGLKHSIAMFFTLLEDRRMFNYTLPGNCIVMGAMNPSDAAYAVTAIESEPAIRRRVKFVWITHSASDWIKYAATPDFHHGDCAAAQDKPCHPDVLAYYRAHPKSIYDVKAQLAGKQYTCPATIQTVSEDAYVLDSAKISLTGDTARTRIGSSIGLSATEQLLAYVKDHTTVVGADDVLYRPKIAVPAIKRLKETSGHEKLADLAENVLALLYADLPGADRPEKLKETAENFLKFCEALPLEQAVAFLQQMRPTAEGDEKKLQYLRDLMTTLQDYDSWMALQLEIDKSHRDVDESLRKDPTT